jgi:hypothetical protein
LIRPTLGTAAFLVALFVAPFAEPALGATTYSPCLSEASQGTPLPGCVTQTRLGPVSSPPPPGEYLAR